MQAKTKMSLGDAIMAVLKREFAAATRITEEGNELLIVNRAGNLYVSMREAGTNDSYTTAVLHENDAYGDWEGVHKKGPGQFEVICIRYIKIENGTKTNEIEHEFYTTLGRVKEEYEALDGFGGFLSVVGLNGGKVTVLIGEEAE